MPYAVINTHGERISKVAESQEEGQRMLTSLQDYTEDKTIASTFVLKQGVKQGDNFIVQN